MNNFTVGSTVKINPNIFGNAPVDTDLYGKLGYVGLFNHLTFRIEKFEEDANRGKGALVSIVNPQVLVGIAGIKDVKYEGLLFVLLDDIVPANIKITLDYTVSVKCYNNPDIVAKLFKERSDLKASGLKVSDPSLRENWSKIQKVRREIEAGRVNYYEEYATVSIKGGKYIVSVPSSMLPKPDDKDSKLKFEGYLCNKIRGLRTERKTLKTTTHEIMGEIVTKLGGVYTEGGQPMKAYEKSLLTTLRADKVPKSAAANYVGVEIEFVHSGRINKMEEMFIRNRLHKNVQLTEDGSVHPCHNAPAGYRGAELRILGTENNITEVLRKTCSVITSNTIDGYVNRSCGLHVHLDMRKRNADIVYKNLVRVMNLLTKSQPAGRTLSKFCVPNKSDDMNAGQEGLANRKYLVVNPMPYLGGRNTIEVRVHEGSVDAVCIASWVEFLNAIANHDALLTKKEYKTAKELAKTVDIPESAVYYIDSRIERFCSEAI